MVGDAFDTDIRILSARCDFRDIELAHPLRLASGVVDRFTLALVSIVAADRRDRTATGTGASVLSVPWSWPSDEIPWRDRDQALRDLTMRAGEAVVGVGPTDPITIHDDLRPRIAGLAAAARADGSGPIPSLAVALASGAIDNAVHDAWARCARRSAYRLYAAGRIREPIVPPFGRPRRSLPVQHVIGLDDPLTAGDPASALRPVDAWVAREGIRHVKVKLAGRDPDADADRVRAIHRAIGAGISTIALDPNEGYAEPAALATTLRRLRDREPATFARIRYVEQPFPRTMKVAPTQMRALRTLKPVIMDEGCADEADLDLVGREAWSGLVVKASKGQTFALRSYAFARQRRLFLALQDLTAVDVALEHSARLASVLRPDGVAFEYNSRQYAPAANAALAARRPDLVEVARGRVTVPSSGIGIA